jgi:hypothetical protein
MIWEDEGFQSDGMESDVEASEDDLQMQTDMDNLISDLALFKRRVAADHEMFGIAV